MKPYIRDRLILYGLGVCVNGLIAVLVASPGYVDAYYYFNGGLSLAEGRGLGDPYLWHYVDAPPSLPTPGFSYWQPLPAFLSALGIALFGRAAPFGAAQAVYVLAGSILPLISYSVAKEVSGQRRHALIAGLLTVFSGFYTIYWSLPESFTPFALSGAGALWLMGRARSTGRGWQWLAAGACAGLAHLTRADGLLLMAILIIAAFRPAWPERDRGARFLVSAVALGSSGYALAMLPWWARNLSVLGHVAPSGGLSTLWLIEYNDLFNYPSHLSAARYFSAGWVVILEGKWKALTGNLATLIGVQNLVFLTPFTVIGLWRRWRDDLFLPATLYGASLFAAMTFAFSWPGVRGGYLHSGGALLPFIFAAALSGLDDTLRWVARRRAGWRVEVSSQVFGWAMVSLAILISAFVVLTRVVGLSDLSTISWNHSNDVYDHIGKELNALAVGETARVMSNNPPGFYTHTGRGGVPLPNGDERALLRAADAYGVDFLVVDRHVVAALADLYLEGPTSERLELIETYGSTDSPVYLYRIRGE